MDERGEVVRTRWRKFPAGRCLAAGRKATRSSLKETDDCSRAASSEVLAVHGGPPVRKTLLPYGRQSIDESDIQAVVETLRSDWLTTGPKVAEFEEAMAAWVGAKYAVSFSSGTAALHAAAFAAGLRPGDEAITSPLTFAATANCVLYQGATPVFADVVEDTLNLDPELAASKITTPHESNSSGRLRWPSCGFGFHSAVGRTPRADRD